MNGWRRSHNTGKPFTSFFHAGRDFRVNCTVEEVLKIGGLDAKLVKFSWISCALESYTVPVSVSYTHLDVYKRQLLGYRQAVRHSTLTAALVGSNPTSPVILWGISSVGRALDF